MAVKASASITVAVERDISSVTRFYRIASSSSTPTQPSGTADPSGWSKAEPAYDGTSTNSLYTTDRTIFTDGTASWSQVSKSSSYEAAKQAYNEAQVAKGMATNYITSIEQDGIWITPEDNKPDPSGNPVTTGSNKTKGWHISDALDLFRDGLSHFKIWIENEDVNIRVGPEDSGHIDIDDDSLEFNDGTDIQAKFGGDGMSLLNGKIIMDDEKFFVGGGDWWNADNEPLFEIKKSGISYALLWMQTTSATPKYYYMPRTMVNQLSNADHYLPYISLDIGINISGESYSYTRKFIRAFSYGTPETKSFVIENKSLTIEYRLPDAFVVTLPSDVTIESFYCGDEAIVENMPTTIIGNGLNSYKNGHSLVIGKFNKDLDGIAFSIGNGFGANIRSNALTVDWDGNLELALDTTAASGTTDGDLYAAITALGWESDVIV